MTRVLTEQLDNLYTTTWQNMKSTVADQVFDATPFFFWLRDKGRFRTEQGGRFITEPLQYDKNENVTWIGKGGTVSMHDFEHLTIAQYHWRYLVANIVRFGVDDQQNRGKNQIISLMNSKLENTQNSLISTVEQRLFGSAGGVDTGFDGLQNMVADDPTQSVEVGSINQADYGWWRNQTENMTGVSFAASGVARMRNMLNRCQNNLAMDRPDIIVSGQTPYEWYEDELLDFYRITNNKLGDAGFENQVFKGLPMVWSPSCSNERMYFINTNFLYFVYDPIMYFDMTEWKPIPDQPNDRAAQIVTACSMVTSRRRVHGVLRGLNTP